jgi:hypothetical protein
MTARRPPSQRNVEYTMRHQARQLQSMAPGALGGRLASAAPVPLDPAYFEGGFDDTDAGVDQILGIEESPKVVVAAGDQIMFLSHIPIDGTLHVTWNGLAQPKSAWTLDDNHLAILDPTSVLLPGDELVAQYLYYNDAATFGISDDFDRTYLGEASGDDGEPYPWITADGTWTCDGSALYPTAVTGLVSLCVIQTDRSDGIVSCSIIGGTGGEGRGMVFRVNDALTSGFGVEMDGRVGYFNSGSDTTLINLGVDFEAGDLIAVHMDGETLTFYKNATVVGEITSTLNQTETNHGFARSVTGGASNGFDQFDFGELT